GEVIKTVPESKIVETLIEEAMKIAEQMEADGEGDGSGAPTGTGKPAVTVG
ncbi:flavodoxin-dependent (E)-4-hydroxy-3-methylbut-2-enyl-diphosphate synthase, partial [Streptomyces hirsutus]